MNGIANIVGGLIGYSIGFIHADIPSWKFPFVIYGSVTIFWGILFTLFVPANPVQAKWLTAREKTIAVMRLASNATGIDTKVFKWYQVREALTDVKVWLIILVVMANNIPNVSGSFSFKFYTANMYHEGRCQRIRATDYLWVRLFDL